MKYHVAMGLLDDFIVKSATKTPRPGGAGILASPGVGGDMRVPPQVKAAAKVESIRREGVLCKRCGVCVKERERERERERESVCRGRESRLNTKGGGPV